MPLAEWTLTHAGETHTLAEWGITSCVISESGLSTGMMTARIPGYMTRTLPFAHRDPVILRMDGVAKFKGITLPMIRSGEGISEEITLRFADPWWWFNQQPYTNSWWDAATEAAYKASRIALFASVTPGSSWAPRTIGNEIAAIVAHCNGLFGGSIMQIGAISGAAFGGQPTPSRMENVMHEAALRKCLSWVPDAIQQWDYSALNDDDAGVPVLSFVQRGSATARTYSFADGTVMMGQKITRRDDLVINGVTIRYRYINTLGHAVVSTDSAGATSGVGVVYTEVDLTGGAGGAPPPPPSVTPGLSQSYDVQSVAFDVEDPQWWFDNANTGAKVVGDLRVGSDAVMVFATNDPRNDGKSGLGGCGLQWLSGGIPQSRENANTRIALVKATLAVRTLVQDPDDNKLNMELVTRIRARVLVPVTKLQGHYDLIIQDETVSYNGGLNGVIFIGGSGLAAGLLAAWSVAQYDGAITITKEECNEPVRLGDVINLTGDDALAEWLDMNAQVQGLTRNIGTGTTEITLGVAKHLTLDEIGSMLNMGRQLKPAFDLDQQVQGTSVAGSGGITNQEQLVNPDGIRVSNIVAQKYIRSYSATEELIIEMGEGGFTL